MILYYIGIDPGLNTGLAVWSTINKKFILLKTSDFWGAIDLIKDFRSKIDNNELFIRIEAPQLISTIFDNRINGKKQAQKLKIAQNVGQNKKESLLLEQYCIKKELNFNMVRPTARTSAKTILSMRPKHETAAQCFNRITGWCGRSSEHSRDAGMLVYGF